jgi:hypothetical protein
LIDWCLKTPLAVFQLFRTFSLIAKWAILYNTYTRSLTIQDRSLYKIAHYTRSLTIQDGSLYKIAHYTRWLTIQDGSLYKIAHYTRSLTIQDRSLYKIAHYTRSLTIQDRSLCYQTESYRFCLFLRIFLIGFMNCSESDIKCLLILLHLVYNIHDIGMIDCLI